MKQRRPIAQTPQQHATQQASGHQGSAPASVAPAAAPQQSPTSGEAASTGAERSHIPTLQQVARDQSTQQTSQGPASPAPVAGSTAATHDGATEEETQTSPTPGLQTQAAGPATPSWTRPLQ